MSDMNRYMVIIIGNSNGIDKDLNEIADGEHGVDFVDSKVLFMGTFYSHYDTTYIHERLAHRPTMMLFNITSNDNYAINLPSKYYLGLFHEAKSILKTVEDEKPKNVTPKAKTNAGNKAKKIEEYTTLNDILDKLSRNNYDRSSLTANEIKILEAQK